ncbi:zinc carboxypeptidase [Xylariales sp. AK1849]|nr:zinc carboxypeptidase [Xylariales sp. AK1849]
MKLLHLILPAASLAFAAVVPEASSKVNYDGYTLFHVEATEGTFALQGQIAPLADSIALQGCTHDDHLDVAVPEHEVEAFQALNLNAKVIHEDLGAAIAEEGDLVPYEAPAAAGALPPASWFSAYHTYADHLTFLSDLQSAFPKNSEVFVAGQSYEKRNITGIHLWGSGGKDSKPVIYYHATVHAREWIATMVAEYLAYSLVSNYTADATVKSFLDNFDFYIITVVNPDGFAYSQSTTRLWRKNRQVRSGVSAVGTDINRNWPYKWDVAGGASTTPSADDYRGEAACDTPECKVLTTFSNKIAAANGIKWYIDFHSYSKAILLPWGYSCTAKVANLAEQQSLANGMKTTIAKAYGTSFEAGPICTTLYEATGGSTDYLTATTGVEFAWAIELRGNSFVLPANQILPSGIEIWNGVKEVIGTFL